MFPMNKLSTRHINSWTGISLDITERKMKIERRSPVLRKFCRPPSILFILLSALFFYNLPTSRYEKKIDAVSAEFNGFNNETGVDRFIVPNIIHLIRFNQVEFSYVDYICIKAAFINHRPDYFYIHTDVPEAKFEGKYWERIQNNQQLKSRIRILPINVPTEIFGKPVSKGWRFYHGSDIARIRILMKYGGIFLDNDVYVIRSLDKYRKFEISLNWDDGQYLGNQVIIANRSARILPLWLDTFQDYRSDLWYFNGGEHPTKEILYRQPHLIHRVKRKFGVDVSLSVQIYKNKDFNWREFDAIHLLMNHRSYLDPLFKDTPYFDEKVVANYSYPFGTMAREVEDYSLENMNDPQEPDPE